MHITVWNDYICPWAYAARPQTAWLQTRMGELGLPISGLVTRSFELHPDLPPEGRDIRPGGRLDQVFDRIAVECGSRDQPFVKPTHTPNARRVLSLAELVRDRHPQAFADFDERVARAHWVDGLDIDDPEILGQLLASVDLEPDVLLSSEALLAGNELLAKGRADAMEVGAMATPSWQIDDLVVTGLHSDAQFHRWFERILSRSV